MNWTQRSPSRNSRRPDRRAAWVLLALAWSGCDRGPATEATPARNTPNAGGESSQQMLADAVVYPRPVPPTVVPDPASQSPQHPARVPVSQTDLPANLPWDDGSIPLTLPDVVLSAAHRGSCLVYLNDRFPDLILTSSANQTIELGELLNDRLTVLVVCDPRQAMSITLRNDLQRDLLDAYRGINVLLVWLGESPASTAIPAGMPPSTVEPARNPAELTAIFDPDGQAFAQIGTGLLPRLYVILPDRTIAWLDVEYSRSTRRDLHAALRYLIQHNAQSSTGPQTPVQW